MTYTPPLTTAQRNQLEFKINSIRFKLGAKVFHDYTRYTDPELIERYKYWVDSMDDYLLGIEPFV